MCPLSPTYSIKRQFAKAGIVVLAFGALLTIASINARNVAYEAVIHTYPQTQTLFGPRVGISIGDTPVVRVGVDGPVVRGIVDMSLELNGFKAIRKICWKKGV